MNTGARPTEQPHEQRALPDTMQHDVPGAEHGPATPIVGEVEPETVGRPVIERIGAIALAVLGLLWIVAVVTSSQAEAARAAQIASRISLASGPLALLGIIYLLLQQSSGREAARFGRTAAAMRGETAALDASVARLNARIEDNRQAIGGHVQALLSLGDDTALRLDGIGARMRSETEALGLQSDRLEAASAAAFTDMGVLVADMPRIEAQIQAMGAQLRDIGGEANDRVTTLSGELATIVDRAREVDEVAGGAAQRLSAHLARIESISDAAGKRIDAAADGIARAVDSALTSAADAVDATRASIEAQSAALLAMVKQSSAAFTSAGGDATESLEVRIAALSTGIESIGARLSDHDAAARALLDMLGERITTIDQAFTEADENGTARATQLAAHLRALGQDAQAVGYTLDRGNDAAGTLIAQGERLQAVVSECSTGLGERLPALLAKVTSETARGGAAIEALLPQADALASRVDKAGQAIAAIDGTLASQRSALDGIGDAATEQLALLEARAEDVNAVLAQAGERALALAGGAGAQLVEAMLRVRETAAQAADQAGRTLGEAIQSAAGRLGEESRKALDDQLAGAVEDKLTAIATASDRAVAAAQAASRRLTDEMTVIAAATSAVERHIAEARASDATEGEDGVSSRVAHLIEQLNSIAIDVAKLLSSDIPDTLWAAYLKGDRGVFTRRATRLVEASETREIARRYETDATFRDQVNRYIHDFEAMLRHILATRDGSLLGVTLLSADMGKLYVALAQAIERLRT